MPSKVQSKKNAKSVAGSDVAEIKAEGVSGDIVQETKPAEPVQAVEATPSDVAVENNVVASDVVVEGGAVAVESVADAEKGPSKKTKAKPKADKEAEPKAAKSQKKVKSDKEQNAESESGAQNSENVEHAVSSNDADNVAAPKKVQKKAKTAKKQQEVSQESSEGHEGASEKVQCDGEHEGSSGLADADILAGSGSQKRYFKCVYNGKTCGRLCGLKPKQAANKAFTSLLKHMKKSGDPYAGGVINFSIVECTRGSRHNKYFYTGERKELPEPVIIKINVLDEQGNPSVKQVPYLNKNFVKKVKKSDVQDEEKECEGDAKPECVESA